VNDRADVAAAVSAGSGVRLGVHLGQRSVSPQEARRVFPGAAAVGVSVHSGEEAGAVAGADYLFAGTIFETLSHAGRAGAGVDRIHQVRESAPLRPTIAIGGVTPARVGVVLAAGAYGVAVMRSVWNAPDPAAAVEELLSALGG
jgi:thiamine-phosphate diphosphorylase